VGVRAAHHVGVDEAEVAHAHVDAEVLDLGPERVGEGLGAGLARAVRRHARRVESGGH
jgi:ribose 5-phosphate isomerase RpiB